MLKVGITGKIAAGKSSVENILRKKGFLTVDLDEVSHNLFEDNKDTKEKILKEFHTLSRKKIGDIVFSDKAKRKKLESIIYPKLQNYILNLFKKDYPVVFISGALLYEAGFDKFFDKIVYIDTNENTRLKRLIKRNNYTETEAKKRILAQKDDYKYKADFVIENNSKETILKDKVDEMLCFLKL